MPADRPRFVFSPVSDAGTQSPVPARGRNWVAFVPVFVLLIAVLAVSTAPETRNVPPAMEALAPSRSTPPPQLPLTRKLKTEEPLVRVNVTPGGVDSLQLELRCRCEVTSMQAGETKLTNLNPGKMTISSNQTGLKLGSHQDLPGQVEILPERSPGIGVNGHLYRGKMRLFRRSDGKVSAVNVLPIENYLASVVDSEMPAKFPEAAREAQAIVARTYALYQIQQANPNSTCPTEVRL